MVRRLIDHQGWQKFAADLEADRGLPSGFLRAIALNETNGGDEEWINKQSKAGAQGMFQFMPATATEHNVNVSDPADSTRGAADYLEKLTKKYGDPHLAAAAYNWGPGNLDKAIEKAKQAGQSTDAMSLANGGFLPKETADYLRKLDLPTPEKLKPYSPEVVQGTRASVTEMMVDRQNDNTIIRSLLNSPVKEMVTAMKNDGYTDGDVIRSIVGGRYDEINAVRAQGGGKNFVEGAGSALTDVKEGAKQIGARLTGDDEGLAQLQFEEADRQADPINRVQQQTLGSKIGSFGVKAIPYAAAAAATGGAIIPLAAGQTAIGAIDGALTPTTGEGQITGNILKSAALAGGTAGAGAGIGKGLGKTISSFGPSAEVAAERAALINRATAEGLPVTPANVSPFWRGVAEANAGSKTINAANEAVDTALAKRVAKGLGEENYSGAIDTNLLNAARDRISRSYASVLDDVSIQIPKTMRDNLDDIVAKQANPLTEGIANNATVTKAIQNIKTTQESGAIVSARQLQDLSSELKELTRSQTASATEKKLAAKVVEQINKTINDALTPEQQAAYRTANAQYRNLKAVEKMVQLSNDSGVVSPRQIVQAIKSGQFKNAFLKDEAPFQELATTAAELYGPANGRGLGDVIGKALNSNDHTLGAASILEPTVGLPALIAKKLGSKGMQKLATTTNPTLVRLLSGTRTAQLDPVTQAYIAKALGASGAAATSN